MRSMTLEQLRAARNAGGVADVTLKGQGGIFLVQITTGSGANAVLAKARSSQPAPLRQSSGRIERIARRRHYHWPV